MEKISLENNEQKFERYAKQWEALTLADDFLFGKVMHDEYLCTEMIKRILPDLDIGEIKFVQTQETSQQTFDTRGVRFDVFAKSDRRKIFDCEIQTSNKKDLHRRPRAYHTVIGLDALKKDSLTKSGSYSNLPDAFVIFICTFDLFKKGRHIYTFKNICEEDTAIKLDDGACTIFLNTEGTMDDIKPELKNFLDFIKGKISDDPFIKILEEKLRDAKQSAEMRSNYMLLLMREEEKLAEGLEKGIAQGLQQGLQQGLERGLTKGRNEGISIGTERTRNLIFERLKASGISEQEAKRLTEI